MKTTVSPIAHRVTLKLDGAIPLEALILNRWEQVPSARREEWLRTLLIRGFEGESGVARTLQREEQCVTDAFPRVPVAPDNPPAIPESDRGPTSCKTDRVVSFAALRKVIG